MRNHLTRRPETTCLKTTDKGQQTEQACCRYLQQQGLKLVEKNYRTRGGEIDLVMRDGDTLVFVEVRYRNSRAYGGAVESVNYSKQQRIMKTAQHYCQQHNIDQPIRIDIVGMHNGEADSYEFEWLQNALQAD